VRRIETAASYIRTALGPHLVQDAESALTAAHRITSLDHVARSTITAPIFHAGSQGRRLLLLLRRGAGQRRRCCARVIGKGRGRGHVYRFSWLRLLCRSLVGTVDE
jgi:hypothetical protein